MTHLYLATSFDELKKQATCDVDLLRNLLHDPKVCRTIYEKALECIDVHKTKKKDEELACVLCMQLETFLQTALGIAANSQCNQNCDPNGKKLRQILSNYLQAVTEIGASLKTNLKSRYEWRAARQHEARHLIETVFSDRPSRSSNDQSSGDRSAGTLSVGLERNKDSNSSILKIKCTERPDSPPAHSSADLTSAELNDLPLDGKIDTYLGSSIADLECYASKVMAGWKDLPSHSVETCSTVCDVVFQAIKVAKDRGDEELQFVLNKLIAAYMQRSNADASHTLIQVERDVADDDLFASYINRAQISYKRLEDSLESRYKSKNALKEHASYLILRPATLEKWVMPRNGPTRRRESHVSQLTVCSSAEMSQSTQQSTENHQPDEKPLILPSQPSTELHSPTEVLLEAPITQAVDDVGFDSLASTGRDVLDRADHALATVDSLSVLTGASTVVAAGGNSVAVAAASPTAAAVAEKPTSDSPAAGADAPTAGTKNSNTCVANLQRPSLPGATGIVNQRNDCYMITIIQTLNSVPGFYEFINEMAQSGSHGLASELVAVLRRLKDGTVADLHELKNVLGTMRNGEKVWASGDQEDAHEFLTHLFDMLEFNAGGAKTPEDGGNRPAGGRRCFAKEQTEFTVQSVVKCNICNSISPNDASMRFLPISISHVAEEIPTLQDCIKWYTQPEPVHCCHCGNVCTKKTDLLSLPNLLIVHVGRFSPKSKDGSSSSVPSVVDHKKSKKAIKFPTEHLDLRSFMPCADETSHYGLYRLIGIVNHHGDEPKNGHYTAHCESLNDGLWYLLNDSSVKSVPVADASATDAYMLFYFNDSLATTQR